MPIRLKLIIIFLVVAIIPIIFVSLVTFHNYTSSMEAFRFSQMRYLTANKAERIESYFNNLAANIEIAAGNQHVTGFLDNQLRKLESILGLNTIFLVDRTGKAIYVKNPLHRESALSNFYQEHKKELEAGKKGVFFSDIYPDSSSASGFSMLATAPVFSSGKPGGVLTGIIAFEVDMAVVYRLIQDVNGMGKTGETLIGKKFGNEVVFLNPLRHDPQAPLKRRITLGGRAGMPVQEAALGKTGYGEYSDYRGVKVIAAWQYIPSLGWGVVAKIDESEAFADIMNLKKLVILIILIVIFLSALMAVSIAQSVSGPIKKLTEGAQIIGSGNLDYKVGTNLNDEIGQLSRSFDKMTGDLKNITASRNELNIEIAERKKVEEALIAVNKELEAFTYSVSHDLRSPLRAIDGFARILMEEYNHKLDAEGKRQFEIISRNIKRMGELIDDLLELSRLGRKELACSSINMKEALDSVMEELKASLGERKVEFLVKEIPDAPADRVLIKQVFINLLTNALKFTAIKKNVIIEIGGNPEPGRNVYYVKDNGVGFDMQYANKLFGIFQRLHGQEEFEGTGIGLAIVKRIITRHGGEVWAEGKVNEGATFYFSLPK
ncbi:MAG: hypothetical protein A2297_08335 [Elusimicrobia bacterium RIFOXYB2_FULL_48_7]|nr:MAG: hypothetical protein A2297_08335 [Elusimicrobia bacterium RIFOXYB2_FULL_48_7]